MPEESSAFSPPTASMSSRPAWRRIRWLAFSRILRVGSAVVIWGFCANLFFPSGLTGFALGAALGFTLWLPTSAILFRVVLFPGEPHPRVRDADGNPVVPEDHRWLNRATICEHLLGSVPLLAVMVWALGALQGTPWLVAVALSIPGAILLVRQLWLAARRLLLSEATLDLATEQNHTALNHLLRFQRLPGRMTDGTLQMLAVAYQRTSQPQLALQTLDRISDPELYEVDRLTEQFARESR